jgi:hypothetical protein
LKTRKMYWWSLIFIVTGPFRLMVIGWYMYQHLSDKIPADDPSVVFAAPFRTNRGLIIENGSAFEFATISPGNHRKLIVPENALVQHTASNGDIEILMKKTLEFAGHPPKPMSIRNARNKMGCAIRSEGREIILGTFGEWGSMEGGSSLRIILIVPDELEVEVRPGLFGPKSEAQDSPGQYLTRPKEMGQDYWYGPAAPKQGWNRVPDEPDSQRRADGM